MKWQKDNCKTEESPRTCSGRSVKMVTMKYMKMKYRTNVYEGTLCACESAWVITYYGITYSERNTLGNKNVDCLKLHENIIK